jgi:colanic acid/amylovoran biosynthesis protein
VTFARCHGTATDLLQAAGVLPIRSTPSSISRQEKASSERVPTVIRLRTSRPTPAHVIVTNCEALNGGDAAILLAIVSLIRKTWPAARLTLMARDAALAARLYPEFEWQDQLAVTPVFRPLLGRRVLSRLLDACVTASDSWALTASRRAVSALPDELRELGRQLLSRGLPQIAAYRDADLVISTGGTYLVSRYNLEPRVVEFLLAKLHAIPLVLYTQSIGSLANSPWGPLVGKGLRYARLILVRDRESRANVAALGLTVDDGDPDEQPVIREHADVVFALADEAKLQAAKQRQLPSKGFRACISVRPWSEFADESADDGMVRYTQAIAALCEHLVVTYEATIEFISTCQGTPGYSRDDSSVALAIAERLPSHVRSKVSVDRSFHTPHALIEHLEGADVVVATRMHMAILSLCAGTPVLPIEYEFKTRHLFHHLGFEHWVEPIQSVTRSSLIAAFDSFAEEVNRSRERLFDAVRNQRRSACESFDVLCETLHYPQPRPRSEAQ